MARRLGFEELEERIAPTVVAAGDSRMFTDSDGDSITVAYNGPDGSYVEVLDVDGGDMDAGEDIGQIRFFGADLSSDLYVYAANPDDTLVIKDDGIVAGDGQDVGSIMIGYTTDMEPSGIVSFDDYFKVDIAGTLGIFATSGDIDCDAKGQWIRAGADIGLIKVEALTLNSTAGTAIFAAGYGTPDSDIHFISVDRVYDSTGGSEVPYEVIPSAGVTIADDEGDGTVGALTIKLSGGAMEGYYLAIPVYGGGSVLSEVYVASSGTGVSITASGTGGDVAWVEFDEDTPGVTLSGAGDTDLLGVWAAGNVGQVVNKTTGGDIGGIWSESGTEIGLIQTGKLGVIGNIFTGRGNSLPIVTGIAAAGHITHVDGEIGAIKVGSISGTTIEAAHISSITVAAGGIFETTIMGAGGIGSLVSKGAIVWSDIYATVPGDPATGGGIGTFTAPMLVGTNVVALGDIGKLTVTRGMNDSMVSTYIDDGFGGHVGGGIASLSVGGMAGSLVETNHGIASAKVGAAGMFNSMIWAHEGLAAVQVSGDVNDGVIGSDWSLGAVKIGGDVIHDSYISAPYAGSIAIAGSLSEGTIDLGGGSSGAVTIGGNLVASQGGIISTGDVASITVKGYVFAEGGEKMHIEGSVGAVSVGGSVHHAMLNFNSAGSVKIGGSIFGGSVYGQTSLGPVSIGRGMYESGIFSDGNVGPIAIKGLMCDSTIAAAGSVASVSVSDTWGAMIACDGNMGLITISIGDLSGADEITVAGDLAGLKVKGIIAGDVTVGGDLTGSILSAGQNAIEYGDRLYFTDVNGQITGATLEVGGAIAPGVVVS